MTTPTGKFFQGCPVTIASEKELALAMIYAKCVIIRDYMAFYQMRDGRIFVDFRRDLPNGTN